MMEDNTILTYKLANTKKVPYTRSIVIPPVLAEYFRTLPRRVTIGDIREIERRLDSMGEQDGRQHNTYVQAR